MYQLIGRNAEIAHLAGAVNGLPDHGGSVIILGEAGIGKTSLAAMAMDRAMITGARVVSVTATESETSLPYAALEQIFHSHSVRLESLRERPRNVLARAFGSTDGETPDVFAVGVAVLEALADIATGTGLLLVVDDAQWVDDSTARVLAFVGRRLADDPVLLILTVRSGRPSPVLNAGLPVMDLDPLTPETAARLLSSRRPSLNASAQERILRHAAGNPLGLMELPADFEGEEDETLAASLRSAFASRVRDVSSSTRRLLLVAALSDGGAVAELDAVSAVLGLDSDAVGSALREFAASGAADVTGGRVAFRHPLVRSAIVSAAPDAERRQMHAALAVALKDDPDRSVWHRAASVSGTDDDIATDLETAAERATIQGNVSVAFRAWLLAGRLSDDGRERARRAVHAAEAALEIGRGDRATEIIAALDESLLESEDAARCALVRLATRQRAAQPRELDSLIRQASSLLDAGRVDLAIELAITVGEHLDAGGLVTQTELSALGKRIAAALPADDPRSLVALAASDPLAHSDRVAQAILALEPAQLDERAELLVRVRFNVDADPVLASMQRRLLESYREGGRLRSIVFLQPAHAWNEICLADWPEALRAAEEGTRLGAELGLPRWATGTLIALGHVAAMRGEHERAEQLILESERGATAAGANNVLTGIQLTKGTNFLAQGRYDEAFTAFRRPLNPGDPSYHPLQSLWCLGDVAETAAHLGRVDEIRSHFQRTPGDPTTPWQIMAETYAEPFLATEPADIEESFERALGGVVAHWPTYRVRMEIEYGAWLRRRRRAQDARDHLRNARDAADALGMRPWSERARSELRALGSDSPPRATIAWEALSPQELEVAQLAALGLSNREIGERLFLSHRTVGSHLYRIFPKLGVTNRAQLASALRVP